jgi:hypothetical protein
MAPGEADIPLWIKVADTLFVCVLVPVYVRHYGLANFLWFSDVALLVTVPALWIESRLLMGYDARAFVAQTVLGRFCSSSSMRSRIRRKISTGYSVPARSHSVEFRPRSTWRP